jgi:hypothetical protein
MPQEPEWFGRAFLACFGLFAALLWVVSLLAPVDIYPLFHPSHASKGQGAGGWLLFVLGWFWGPMGLSIAWYGNVSLLICIGILLAGRVPGFKLATTGRGLGLSGLLPVYYFDMVWGQTPSLVRGPAVWAWLAAFAIVWIPAASVRWLTPGADGEQV